MSTTDTTTANVFRPSFDIGEFRDAVAGYVRTLILARWKCEPGFLTRENLGAWGLHNIGDDRWPAWRLLDQAASALGVLNTDYLPRCGSGGVAMTDQSTPVGRLIWHVAWLADLGDANGPEHNSGLREAARLLREGKAVDWNSLVAWDKLRAIRADLDLLPHPRSGEDQSRLDRVEALLSSLVEREQVRDHYSIEEFARMVGKADFTCREWCRHGRIRASKKQSGRGKHPAWVISHEELLRYRKDGLLPLPNGRDA